MSLCLLYSVLYLSCSLLKTDYTANSNFLSTQGHQNLRPVFFSEGWFIFVIGETGGSCDTLSPSGKGYLYLPHQAWCPTFTFIHVRHQQRLRINIWWRAHVWMCALCADDSGFMWRHRLSFKRFSFTQVNYITAHCLGGGERESERERKHRVSPN